MQNQILISEIQATLISIISNTDSNSLKFSLVNWKTVKGKLSSSKLASSIQLNEGILSTNHNSK
jgi:hypothetical protein